MSINWRLFIIGAVLTIGVYLVLAYPDIDNVLAKEKHKKYRTIGWVMIVVSILASIYFHYTGDLVFKATMNGPCSVCNAYRSRKSNLRRFDPAEKGLLEKYARGCKQCSDMCNDNIQLMRKNPKTTVGELRRARNDCIRTTETALQAQGDLARLQGQIAAKGVPAMRLAGQDLLFPKVPY